MLTGRIDPALAPALACVEEFYRRMFRDGPGAVTQQAGDCTLAYCGDPSLTGANHVWPGGPDALTPGVLAEARRFFRRAGAHWSVVVAEPALSGARAWLVERGFFPRWESPLMVLEGPPALLRVHPTAQPVQVTTPGDLAALRDVMAASFGTGANVNRRVARRSHLSDPAITHYLVHAGAEPVACATLAPLDGVGGVWNVGTRPRYRRQGYAAALMAALLADLRAQGVTTSALLASRDGYPLYARLGYRRIGTVAFLGPPDQARRWRPRRRPQ